MGSPLEIASPLPLERPTVQPDHSTASLERLLVTVVALLAQRLDIGLIPVQRWITFVRLDVVGHRGVRGIASPMA